MLDRKKILIGVMKCVEFVAVRKIFVAERYYKVKVLGYLYHCFGSLVPVKSNNKWIELEVVMVEII